VSIHASKRSIWVTNNADFGGNEPPFGKILAYDSRIEGVYVNGTGAFPASTPEDRFVTQALMNRIRSFGLLAGCWFVPRSTIAMVEASKAANMVTWLNPDCVLLDIETHDLDFQRAFVAEYRRLKPGRATDVTFEPRQDGTSVAVQEYIDARFDLFPQLYEGRMRPADPKHELFTWVGRVGWGKVHLCLDAAQDWWALDDGLLFTAETLPDKRAFLTRTLARVAPKRTHDKLAAKSTSVEPCGDELEVEAA